MRRLVEPLALPLTISLSVAELSPPSTVSIARKPPWPTKFALITNWSPATPLCMVIMPALVKVARPLNVVVTGPVAPLWPAMIVPVEVLVSVSEPPPEK